VNPCFITWFPFTIYIIAKRRVFLNKKGRRKMVNRLIGLGLVVVFGGFAVIGMCFTYLVFIDTPVCLAQEPTQPVLPIDEAVQQVDQTLVVFWTVVDNIPMTGTQRRALEQPTQNLMKAMEDLKKSQEEVSKKLVSLEPPKEEGAK
jgi:hypothetical protein